MFIHKVDGLTDDRKLGELSGEGLLARVMGGKRNIVFFRQFHVSIKVSFLTFVHRGSERHTSKGHR